MEKTTQITIASTAFSLTESAYNRLRTYLDNLEAHFRGTADASEILRDIEARIAEKLLESRHAIVTDHTVASVIREIGEISDLDDAEDSVANPDVAPRDRKLYRNPDD